MRSYQIILVRDDGEQRKLRVKWDTSPSKQELCHGLDIQDEVAKYIGHELQEAIREWEEEDTVVKPELGTRPSPPVEGGY